MKILLSIIVPVYNAEKWLHRCVDSLLDQELPSEDYEIILVDDGSKDASPQICDEYAAAYSGLVRVIHQPNGGVSMARNAGLDAAVGEYVMFVDADDYIEPNCLHEIVGQVYKSNAEVLFYKHKVVTEQSERIDNSVPTGITVKDFCTGEYYMLNNGDTGSIWRSLYSRDVIESLKLRFYPNITHQDVLFNFQILPFVERIAFCDVLVYDYIYEGESLTRTKSEEKIKYNIYNDFVVAAEIKNYIGKLSSAKLRDFCEKHANSLFVGLFYLLFMNKQSWGINFCNQCLELCIERGVYPIKGCTKSWKTTMLIPLINCRWLIKWMLR